MRLCQLLAVLGAFLACALQIHDEAAIPDIVIFGVGDSGTRGVKAMMENLGVAMCGMTNPSGDNLNTMETHKYISELLLEANGRVSARKGNWSSPSSKRAIEAEVRGAQKTWECIEKATKNISMNKRGGWSGAIKTPSTSI